MDLKIYDTKAAVATRFAAYLEDWLREKDQTHIALSGGSTPKILFEELSKRDKYTIDWSGVNLYWGDERCVPPSDDQSNYKMTQEFLLRNIPVPEGNIHRIKGESDPEEEAVRYADLLDNKLPKTSGIPTFDMVILGMGEDGHTASIFPHEIHLWNSDRHCAVATHPDSGQKRITITGNVINHSKSVVFLVTGAGKAEKINAIFKKTEGYEQYPASLVNPAKGKLTWFLDAEAAALL